MNKKQAELIGVFSGLPAPYVSTYYLDKFKNIHVTSAENLVLDSLINEFAALSIIPRGTKTPIISINGFNRITITPDIISGRSDLSGTEIVDLRAGQTETVIQGTVINNYDALRDKHLAKLKRAYLITAERLASELYLTGKMKLPVSNDVIDIGYSDVIEKNVKKSSIDWSIFLLNIITEYRKDNGIFPTTIEVDIKIYEAMMGDEKFRDQIKTFNHVTLDNNPADATIEFSIWKYRVRVLPTGVDGIGNEIDTSNLIYLSSEAEFVKGYTGIPYSNNGRLDMFKGEYLITEITEANPPSQYYLLYSGFCPIIPIPKRVKRYKLNLT